MIEPREQRIALPGLTLAAKVWGDDALPPLLALHGWLDNAGSFSLLAPSLATRFQVIALDLPGHGYSDHLAVSANYHFLDYVRTVVNAADALKLGRFNLLGHSLGAGVASLVAAACPSRIERMWLIDGLGPLGDDGGRTLQRFQEAFAPTAARKPLRLFPNTEQAISARSIASGLRPEWARSIVMRGLVEVDGDWRWRSDSRLMQSSPVRLAEAQAHALLRGISAPTALLLAQPAQPYLPTELMRARVTCVDDIVVSYMDGCHHLHLEHPAAVATWIKAAPAPAA